MSNPSPVSFLVRVQNLMHNKGRLACLAATVALHVPRREQRPVIFFNASTRINNLSLNAGFSLVTSWAVRLAGVPVVHFVCNAGMSRCVLGSDPDHPEMTLPCKLCVRQSHLQTIGAKANFFPYHREEVLAKDIQNLPVEELMRVTYKQIPLGAVVLPSLRWRMRAHHLQDDQVTRFLYREFILSAWNVAREFSSMLERVNPQAVVLFNGQFFPEATALYLARQRGIRTVTHEVGLQPNSAYFTKGEATAYPIQIPDSFDLSAEQNARLDAYLENRFQGKFSMAGIQFWPEMKGLDDAFKKMASGFKQTIPVFTNVIFDTSQPHSNVIFADMFAWLDLVLEAAKGHPETLFVLRAHPDESRSGKAARESVAMWVKRTSASTQPNILFVPPDEFISSYELIQLAKFVMIYNSTIGLEASILGAAVLSAGKARFTQYPTVFFPESRDAYHQQLESFLWAESIPVPVEFRRNARRFLYYQLFRTSLPFGEFLESSSTRGYVRLRGDGLKHLNPRHSPSIHALLDGILHNGDFLLKD